MKKKLVFLLVIVLIGYSLFLIAEPHYNHYAFKSELRGRLNLSVGENEKKIMKIILEIAEQYNIPIEEQDIRLHKDERHYAAVISWEEPVNFFNVYQKTFEFHVDTSQ